MGNKNQITGALIAVMISLLAIISVLAPVAANARARIVSPRFGSPIRLDQTNGATGTGFLDSDLSVIIATDPADQNVPNSWSMLENWEIGLSTAHLENGEVVGLTIASINKISNPVVGEGDQDSSILSKNAIEILARVPGNIFPGLYNLHVGYKIALPESADIVNAGDFIGQLGTGTAAAEGFILSEGNCVYIPSIYDASAQDSTNSSQIPFSLIHISDIHVMFEDPLGTIPDNYYRLQSLIQGISVWAPDIVIASGDITNDPDNKPNEYSYAYMLFRSMGIPMLAGNGNHDQGNLGLFPYYFGPIQQANQWGGTRLININSVMPPTASSLDWIVNNIKYGAEENEAVFLIDHYPIMDIFDREMQSSVGTILGAMLKYNSSGVLNGHNHYNIIYDMEKAYATYNNMGNMQEACDIPSNVGDDAPQITGPKIFLTTSASKEARTGIQNGVWPDYTAYLGYRRISISENNIMNYSYDLDGDGVQDPSYGYPTEFASFGGVNCSLTYNPDNIMAGAQYHIVNNLTEAIPWARAAITLPSVSGYRWAPQDTSLFVRTQFANATHEYLDIRVEAPARSSTSTPTDTIINLVLVPEVI